jgi:tetratricopeptide (TPR) repeat protein
MSSSYLGISFQIMLVLLIFTFILGVTSSPTEARRGASKINLRGTSKLEANFFNDLKNQRLQNWSLADAFFIASGIRDEESLIRARLWYQNLVDEAEQALAPYKTTADRADQLLQWLHKRVLKTYRTQATDALDIIRSGRFNCLSSCIIYGMLGEKLGLHIKGIAVDQHAFCRVYARPVPKNSRSMKSRSGGWDVETTTALGFNPGRTVQIDRAVVSVPRSRYRNRREISLMEMIGLIYTNHIGMTRAYPTHEDRLLAYQKATLFFPRDPIIKHNIIAAHTQVIQDYASRKRWQGAHVYLEQLADFDQKDQYVTALWMQVAEQHLDVASYKGLERALETLETYQTKEIDVPSHSWGYLRGQLYGRAAAHLYDRGRFDQAEQLFNKACLAGKKANQSNRHQRRSNSVKSALQRLRHNHLVIIKNCIINVFNQKEIKRAQTMIALAVKSNPRDTDLSKLKRKINQAPSTGSRVNSRRSPTKVKVNRRTRRRSVRRR